MPFVFSVPIPPQVSYLKESRNHGRPVASPETAMSRGETNTLVRSRADCFTRPGGTYKKSTSTGTFD